MRLRPARPHAGEACASGDIEAEGRAGADNGLFHVEKELPDAAGPFLHAEDGVGHQLAGKVAGDVAAAQGLGQLYALGAQMRLAHVQVFTAALPPQGDDLGVLQQVQRLLAAALDLGQGAQLQGLGLAVGNEPQTTMRMA